MGTTSACAENTPTFWERGAYGWNYLRVRGEYRDILDSVPSVAELPPRARRIPDAAIPQIFATGTTSACAENTSDTGDGAENKRNYLRVRGEYSLSQGAGL